MWAVAGDLELHEEFLIGIDDPEANPVDENMRGCRVSAFGCWAG